MRKLLLFLAFLFIWNNGNCTTLEKLREFWDDVHPNWDLQECVQKYGERKCLYKNCMEIDFQHPSCSVFGREIQYGDHCCDMSGAERCGVPAAPLNSECNCEGMPDRGKVCR